jgi:ketosteroid isomerase-like protein
MLFVAAMEVLTAAIKKAAERQLLTRLAGISELQRISVYADDVVSFCKPLSAELEAVKAILHVFGEASGLCVNYRKTSATLIREQDGDVVRVAETLGCEVVGFPIKYLGMQLALRPLTKRNGNR